MKHYKSGFPYWKVLALHFSCFPHSESYIFNKGTCQPNAKQAGRQISIIVSYQPQKSSKYSKEAKARQETLEDDNEEVEKAKRAPLVPEQVNMTI